MTAPETTSLERRDFLKSSAAVTGTIASLSLPFGVRAYAAEGDQMKVGLVGCGGRGTGAAQQALTADSQVKLVAVADAFRAQIDGSLKILSGNNRIADQVAVAEESKFTGLDGYKRVIDMCDVVLLASPPGFRPVHLKAAVEAGRHIFTEKPMATDAPGCRSVIETVKVAKEKKLALVAGFCWRYDTPRREFFKRIQDGQIGDIVSIYGTYLTSPVKPMPPASTRPEGITDLEWMVRNWYNFTWLSGDGLVEQAIHTVDWLQWVMKDVPPSRCTAVGGRQIPAHGGNIYDHIEVNYEWEGGGAGGTRGFMAQRQIPGCHNENSLYVHGTKGVATIRGGGDSGVVIEGANPWKYDGPKSRDMYQIEHDEFFDSIRTGKPINDGDRMVTSTLAGIMGRMAGYTGKQVSWEMALNSKEVLVPELTDWNSEINVLPMAQPGVTPFI
ncbi:MAG: Gfo/Idh/MocA family oxidoreductase [Planctomycetes bacterium]|nr:Gfo/Idh/MocA family oxidoreductase [Planctomycetota bacterium]